MAGGAAVLLAPPPAASSWAGDGTAVNVEEDLYYHPAPLPSCHLWGAVQALLPRHFFLTFKAELLSQFRGKKKKKKSKMGFRRPVHNFTRYSDV